VTDAPEAAAAPDDLLASYRRRASEEIERRLPHGEPREWLYEPLADYPRRSGKGLRAALCLAACAAHGGEEDDALAALSLEVLRADTGRLGRRLGLRILSEFSSAMWQTLEGQAVELGWRRDGVTNLSPQNYLELILRKTCWYTTIAPLRIGALIGSWGSADLQALSRFGLFLGAAFQITDDVLNLTGGQGAYGKEIRGDLREGKRTLMVIHLLSVAEPPHRDAVAALLRGPAAERTDDRLDWLADLLERYGSIAFARDFARGVADAAAAAFPEAFRTATRPERAEVIRQLIGYVVERTR